MILRHQPSTFENFRPLEVNTPPPKERWLLGVGRLKSILRLKPLRNLLKQAKGEGESPSGEPRSGSPLTGTILLEKNRLTASPRSACPLTGTTPPRNTNPLNLTRLAWDRGLAPYSFAMAARSAARQENYVARRFHALLSHPVLKLPPEGGGFDPPKWGH